MKLPNCITTTLEAPPGEYQRSLYLSFNSTVRLATVLLHRPTSGSSYCADLPQPPSPTADFHYTCIAICSFGFVATPSTLTVTRFSLSLVGSPTTTGPGTSTTYNLVVFQPLDLCLHFISSVAMHRISSPLYAVSLMPFAGSSRLRVSALSPYIWRNVLDGWSQGGAEIG